MINCDKWIQWTFDLLDMVFLLFGFPMIRTPCLAASLKDTSVQSQNVQNQVSMVSGQDDKLCQLGWLYSAIVKSQSIYIYI
jgi:hypothetical protein